MPGLLPNVDPDGLLEFSVVYTDRPLNHMSAEFKKVITDISAILKDVYKAHSTVVVPKSEPSVFIFTKIELSEFPNVPRPPNHRYPSG